MARLVRGPPEIRPARAADLPELAGLVGRYWAFEAIPGFDPPRIRALLERLLAEPERGRAWLARSDAEPVGYLLGVYVLSFEHQGLTAEIDELFVLPEQRSRGIGAALLKDALAAFGSAGCTRVQLQLARGNEAARRFYHRHGFAERQHYELLDRPLARG